MSAIPFNAHISDIQKISFLEDHLSYLKESIAEKCSVLGLETDDDFLNSYVAPEENPLSYEIQLEKLISDKKTTINKINEIRG